MIPSPHPRIHSVRLSTVLQISSPSEKFDTEYSFSIEPEPQSTERSAVKNMKARGAYWVAVEKAKCQWVCVDEREYSLDDSKIPATLTLCDDVLVGRKTLRLKRINCTRVDVGWCGSRGWRDMLPTRPGEFTSSHQVAALACSMLESSGQKPSKRYWCYRVYRQNMDGRRSMDQAASFVRTSRLQLQKTLARGRTKLAARHNSKHNLQNGGNKAFYPSYKFVGLLHLSKLNPVLQRPHARPNPNLHHIPRLQKLWFRLHRIPDARTRARHNHCTPLERRTLAHIRHQGRDLEAQIVNTATLPFFAINFGLKKQFTRIREEGRRYDLWTDRRVRVEAFAEVPLRDGSS
jgi:hypothetical protein